VNKLKDLCGLTLLEEEGKGRAGRPNTSFYHVGGIGTMMAVSSGEGTAYHYDSRNKSM
jgi:hypothetical protein